MIPSLVQQVMQARVPSAQQLFAQGKREDSIRAIVDALRAHGNLNAYRCAEVTGKSQRMCREYLEELENRGIAYSWKAHHSKPRMWGLVK